MSSSEPYRIFLTPEAEVQWHTSAAHQKRYGDIARRGASQAKASRAEVVGAGRTVLAQLDVYQRKPAPKEAQVLFARNDGGREAAGFKGDSASDCVTRAICIATGKPYREVCAALNEHAERERPRKGSKRSSAASGVHRKTYERYLLELGFTWTPTMKIGQGCKVHLRRDELPATGRHVLSLSGHLAAWVEGVLYDTFECSREGTRCVYGYYTAPDGLTSVHPADLMVIRVA